MNSKFFLITFFIFLLSLQHTVDLHAFTQEGCGTGECKDCHVLNKKEAAALLSLAEENITELKFSEVPGLWEIDVRQQNRIIPVFLDFSKQYLISGSVVKIADKQDITKKRFVDLNRVDVSQIPLDDALVVGSPSATMKVIVFDDPECSFCAKLQNEMKQVVDTRSDIAFFIKMFPLQSHPEAYGKAKAIVCSNSLAMLEESLAGKPLDPPSCETDVIDRNIRLAEQMGINSTPTLVFPDGRVMPGYKPSGEIIRLLENPGQ